MTSSFSLNPVAVEAAAKALHVLWPLVDKPGRSSGEDGWEMVPWGDLSEERRADFIEEAGEIIASFLTAEGAKVERSVKNLDTDPSSWTGPARIVTKWKEPA